MKWDEKSQPNQKLYENPNAQQWLHELADVRPSDFPTLRCHNASMS